MSPRRASLPPPLPPLRVCPDTSPRFRSGRARSVCSLPPPTPGGGKITKTKTACATCSPFPTPPPARAWPSTSLRFRSGPCPSRLLAAPPHSRWGLLITSIHTFQHNYCVSAPPSPGRFFFLCSIGHLGQCLATLRPGPRRSPSQRFSGCAHHKSNS
jgi:hypothetical protein